MDDGPPVRDDGSGPQSTEEPYFSIVTITKDDPAGIRRTVGSVEAQNFSRYQHVIVNGGSQADVARWLEGWRDADPGRHLLIDDAPPGIYPAMNAGVDGTTAPLVVVVNGGDELRPGALTAVVEHHRLHRWRWAYGGVEGKDLDGRLLGDHTFQPFSQLVFRSGIDFIPHTAAYVTRQLYREVGPYREDLGTAADQEFFLRASLVARPGLIPGLLATFEVGGTSSHEGALRRELIWHRLRLASKTAFGGSSATDLVVTAALVARQVVLAVVRRTRRAGVTAHPGSERPGETRRS